MTEEAALPTAEQAAASIQSTDANPAINQPGENTEGTRAEAKPEKTPAERELARAQRKIDRLVRQREELRAERNQLQPRQIDASIRPEAADSETLSLSPELEALVNKRAQELAAATKQGRDEAEHRRAITTELAKGFNKEAPRDPERFGNRFDEIAFDLDEAFGGLADRSGKPKPATDAIFESDAPKALIEYLADPENADEADALSHMSAIQAGRAVAKIEIKLAAAAAKAKPQPSNLPAPLEALKGKGPVTKALADMGYEEFVKARRKQIAARR